MNEQFASAGIGVSTLAFAVMTNVGSKSLNPTYSEVIHCDGLISVDPGEELEVEKGFIGMNRWVKKPSKIVITKTSFTPTLKSLLLGKTVTNGVVKSGITDEAPYVAVFWEKRKANGKRVRKCIPMARFSGIKEIDTTKTDAIEFAHAEISGEYIHTLSGIKMLECDEESGSAKFGTWFTKVPF